MELQGAIINLLASNNYISLPGIGSFVQRYEPAKLSVDSNSFLPPRQEVTFDESRTFNDNALEQHLIDKEGMPEKEAEAATEEFIEKLKQQFQNGERILFQGIGYLYSNELGVPVLEPLPDDQRASSTFGLKPIEVKEVKQPISVTQADKKPEQQPVKPKAAPSKPIVKQIAKKGRGTVKSRQVIAAAASALILIAVGSAMLYLFAPLMLTEDIPKKPVPTKEKVPTPTVPDTQRTESNGIANNEYQKPEADIQAESVHIATDRREALLYRESDTRNGKSYYIISGSFVEIENAQMFCNSLSSRGFNPEIIESNGVYRVAISKFSERNRALRELNRLRAETNHQEVWLLAL